MTARVQEARATTANTPPVNNSLKPGQLYIELAAPVRLWVGVPTNLAASGQKMIYDQDQTATFLNAKVSKIGDTMTGPLVLSGDPTANLHAATKQYVDAVRTASVPIAGGTMTGLLLLSGDPVAAFGAATKQYVDNRDNLRLALTGGTLTGPLILAADPGVPLGAATKQYVDGKVAGATYPYLPLTGGTVTGNLTVSGKAGVGPAPPANAVTGSLFAGFVTAALGVNLYSDGTNWRYLATGSGAGLIGANGASYGGLMFYSTPLATNAGDVAALTNTMIVNPGGVAVTGVLNVSNTISGSGAIISNGNYVGLNSGAFMQSDASYTYFRCDANGWGWVYTRSNGNMQYQRGGDYVNLFNIGPDGSVVAQGQIAAVGSIRGNGGLFPDSSGNWGFFNSGGYRYQQFTSGWNWNWNISNGQYIYSIPGGTQYQFSVSDYVTYNWLAAQAGNGAYVNVSDERVKFDVNPADHGMDVIRAIKPITFHRVHGKTRKPQNRQELGFSAQQLRDILPHAVVPLDAPDEWKDVARTDPLMGVTIEPIVAALVNAVSALHDRVNALETPT